MNVLTIQNLIKSFGSKKVLCGLELSVQEHSIFGFIGKNGAGKTTTLECIEGLRKYDSGAITVKGKMGIQLQSSSLPAHIKPMEAVKLFARYKKCRDVYLRLWQQGRSVLQLTVAV